MKRSWGNGTGYSTNALTAAGAPCRVSFAAGAGLPVIIQRRSTDEEGVARLGVIGRIDFGVKLPRNNLLRVQFKRN